MGPLVQALRIENLEARIGLQQFVCAELELEIELARSAKERRTLSARRTQAIREQNLAKFALELLKREAE